MKIGQDTSGALTSIWFEHIHRPEFPNLNENLKTQVCIIGAGITGLTAAYQLIQEGKKVIVIEDGRVGSGESGRTSAHLTSVLDDRYLQIENVHGEEGARFAAASHTAAIDYIEKLVRAEQIDCDFLRVDGYLFPNENDTCDTLEKEAQAAARAGLTLELLKAAPENTFAMKGCIRFPNQAQFHPLKYLVQLAKCIKAQGGHIFELTHAEEIKAQEKITIKTPQGHLIEADQVIVATNVPVNDKVVMHTKLEPYRTYMIAFMIPKSSLKQALYWDTGDPYHYIRLIEGPFEYQGKAADMVIIGGEDHRVGEPSITYDHCFKQLEQWSKKYFPNMSEIVKHWSGQIIEPVDYLAFIGHNPFDNKNIFISTGDSGNGLTHGTLAGILLSDLILKKENPWTALYNPSRKSLKTAGDYLKHNINTLATYFSYFTKGNETDVSQLSRDSGMVVRRGLEKIAVYRDEKGNFHECTAICPHLQSIVRWNSAEKSWDCPAHGSRFTAKGEVVNGPANKGLACGKAKAAEETHGK